MLAQILDGLEPKEFARCAKRYPMFRDTPALSAYDHFATMVFAQLTYREGLRDIEVCLGSRRRLLYHSGIRGGVKRCNLAYANEHRDARLFAEVAAVLMRRAQRLYADESTELGLDGELFAVDSSLIELSLALFPWARWQGTQAAVKLNVMLAVTTEIPAFCTLVEGRRHDVNFLDDLPLTAGSYYVFDRGYLDFRRLRRITQAEAWFVIRAKCNTRFYVCESRPVDKATGLRCDQIIRLNTAQARRDYPEKLRRIRYYDAATDLSLVFLTNNFALPALVIAAIYRRRWEIELFFRWIKQHLRLRGFFSNCPNGVAVQIWTAICAYLLVAIAKRQMAIPGSLHQVLQIVSISALEKVPLPELFMKDDTTGDATDIHIQLEINGF
ncbi:MAG: IS4 family transposase [Rhodospirillales bacterium]|nr:IS4 family transposase [Rhodospirillales bacterium]